MAECPKRYNVPAYASVLPHGSWGIAPQVFAGQAVIATPAANQEGGYPSTTQLEMRQLNPMEHADMIRLTVAIVGDGGHGTLKILLGEVLKTKCNKNINHIAPLLLTFRPSNPKYHMVQEEVEHHNLMVNIRNLARTAITARATSEDEKADIYEDFCLDLQNRAAGQIDRVIKQHMTDYSGARAQVLRARLLAIRRKVMADLFAAVAEKMEMEKHYWLLNPAQKTRLWLDRYDDLVVAWYWSFRGIMDIQAILAHEPMKFPDAGDEQLGTKFSVVSKPSDRIDASLLKERECRARSPSQTTV